MNTHLLKALPSIEQLITLPPSIEFIEKYGRDCSVNALRDVLAILRKEFLSKEKAELPKENELVNWIIERTGKHLKDKYGRSLKKAINAAGVILHTGLGRAVLSKDAADAIADIIQGYCTLATDIETGRRGHRDVHVSHLICELTGAEAAVVVNNNAAATMLILNTLAKGREVILSRGQLVEIGGSFRMPDVMQTSGAILRDVGTTNKTHLKDYREAIGENTAAIMRVHHSNYRILGFFSEPEIKELADLAHEHGLPLIDDIGSGALVDLTVFGLDPEPLIRKSLEDGADVLCFSGDKLIGGPQAGIIVGKADIIKKISKNPLTRAFRVGKLTIAALEATLKLFLNQEKLFEAHPVYAMFAAKTEQLGRRALRVCKTLTPLCGEEVKLDVIDGRSQIGSGSAPVETIPSKLLSIKSSTLSPLELAKRLRIQDPPVFARIHQESVLLDFRTINPQDDKIVTEALKQVLIDTKRQ